MRLLPFLHQIPNRSRRGRGRSRSQKNRRSLCLESLETRTLMTGTWTALANPVPSPNGTGTMLLQPDGTVMVEGGAATPSQDWYKLTPDSSGNYADGTWSSLAPMNVGRRFFASDVLPSGNVFVAGGEYSTAGGDTNTGEIYNPAANTWTKIPNFPEANLGDGISEVLQDGQVLVGSINDSKTYLYNPENNAWSNGPSLLNGDSSSEESWVKLPDGSILTYEIQGTKPQTGQRLIPGATDAQDQWIPAGNVPVPLASDGGNTGIDPELGPAVLLPNGQVFFIGASGNTAIYTPPSTLTGTGTWVAGPTIKDNAGDTLGAFDAPAAMETDGNVLFAAGAINGFKYPGPTVLFEYNPTANTITQVTAAGPNLNVQPFQTRMLDLPNGQVLFTNSTDTLYVYTPSGAANAAWKPTISNIAYDSGSTFTLTGMQINGLSEGAAYGDDAQMASNYPIVQLTNASGQVSYARTANWSSTSVATGSTPESVNFTLPAQDGPGVYSLSVIANGIASTPAVVVVGSSGNDTVTVDTSVLPFFHIPTVTATLNGATSSYFQFGVSSIYVFTEGGSNTVNIEHTVASIPVTVDLVGGSGTVNISPSAKNLTNIQGSVSVEGDYNSADALDLYDQNNASQVTYSATSSTMTRTGAATVSYSSIGSVNLEGGNANNTYNIVSTAYKTPMTIFGGAGNDTFNVSPTAKNLSNIQGALTVWGLGGSNSLNVYDQNDTGAATYSVTSSSVTRSGSAAISYASVNSVNLYGGSGNDTYNIESTASGMTVFIEAVPATTPSGSAPHLKT